jgi:hypothetical protein
MAQPPSEEELIKRRLLWKKVSDPNFVEQSKPQNERPKSFIDKAVVPMIPSDLLAGSSSDVNENKTFRNMSLNPLVPIGMIATVACLIGKFLDYSKFIRVFRNVQSEFEPKYAKDSILYAWSNCGTRFYGLRVSWWCMDVWIESKGLCKAGRNSKRSTGRAHTEVPWQQSLISLLN